MVVGTGTWASVTAIGGAIGGSVARPGLGKGAVAVGGAANGGATRGGATKGGAITGALRYPAAAARRCKLIALLLGKRIDCLALVVKAVCIGSQGMGSEGEFWLGRGGVGGVGSGI